MTIQQGRAIGALRGRRGPRPRSAKVASVAAAHAVAVDREARFPAATVEALKSSASSGPDPARLRRGGRLARRPGRHRLRARSLLRLLGHDRRMDGTKIACLVRHGPAEPRIDGVLRRVAGEQLLLGFLDHRGAGRRHVRSLAAAIETRGRRRHARREATVISYGAQADGIVTVARRAPRMPAPVTRSSACPAGQ